MQHETAPKAVCMRVSRHSGVLQGIASGTVYPVPIEVAQQYFPQAKARVMGIATAGFSLSPFFFDGLQTLIINPSSAVPTDTPHPDAPTERYFNAETQPNVIGAVPKAFIIMAAVYAILIVLSFVLLMLPKASLTALAYYWLTAR